MTTAPLCRHCQNHHVDYGDVCPCGYAQSFHYRRVCDDCGDVLWSVHCKCEGPRECPGCGGTLPGDPDPNDECECEFDPYDESELPPQQLGVTAPYVTGHAAMRARERFPTFAQQPDTTIKKFLAGALLKGVPVKTERRNGRTVVLVLGTILDRCMSNPQPITFVVDEESGSVITVYDPTGNYKNTSNPRPRHHEETTT
jgi:hypothetical protein